MRQLYFAVILLITLSGYAQKNLKITDEDVSMARSLHTQFPDDHLVLLQKTNTVTFDFDKKSDNVTVEDIVAESYINIKNERKSVYAFEFYDEESEIDEFMATASNHKTLLGQPQDEAYTSEGLFHNDVRVKYIEMGFPVEGSRNYLDFTKKVNDVKYYTKLYFTGNYPIRNRKVTIEVPNWLEVEFKEINFENFDITKEVTTTKTGTVYTFTAQDLPAEYKESRMPGPSYVYPHLLVLAKSHTRLGAEKKLFATTADLYHWGKKLVDELTNDNQVFKDKVAELIKDAKSDDEKIKNIFYWVQDNIRYIAFEDGIAGFKPDEASNVFTKKYGDCKGMANLIKQMLVEAGFDARLCWIGTKHLAYTHATPSLSVDNHMICTVLLNGHYLFLDGTEDYNAYGEYADRIQGREVIVENGEDYELLTVPSKESSFNLDKTLYDLTIDDEKLKGVTYKHLEGEARKSLLQYFHTLRNDNKEDFLKFYLSHLGNKNTVITDITTSDLLIRDIPIDIEYVMNCENYISSYGNELYVGLEFENAFADVDLTKRKTDYIMGYKKNIESLVSLTIPSGYKVTYVPNNILVENNEFSAEISYTIVDDKLVYSKKFNFPNGKISKANFSVWNAFLKQLKASYQEQIVLTKQ